MSGWFLKRLRESPFFVFSTRHYWERFETHCLGGTSILDSFLRFVTVADHGRRNPHESYRREKAMKKRFRGISIALAVLFLIAIGSLLRTREPLCRDKTIAEWVRIFDMDAEGPAQSTDTPACREAREALRSMRDESVSRALRLLRSEKPAWKRRVEGIIERADGRRWLPRFMWRPFYGDPGDDAPIYFWMLGSTASGAIPELVGIIGEDKSWRITQRAFTSLGGIGSDALPALIDILRTNSPHRRDAVMQIRWISRNSPTAAASAIPSLLGSLGDADVEVSMAAATALGDFQVNREQIAEALVPALRSTNTYVRFSAAESLEKLGEQARVALPALVKTLDDPAVLVRTAATNAVSKIAPEVLGK